MKEKRGIGALASLASALIFGFIPVLTVMIFKLGYNPISVIFYRSTICLIPIAIYLVLKHEFQRIRFERFLKIVIMCAFTMTVTSVLMLTSYKYIGIGLSTALHFLYPTSVVLLELIIWKKKLNRGKTISLTLALSGTFLICSVGGNVNFIGIAMAAASSITYALYMIAIERMGIAEMSTMNSMLYLNIGNSIGALAASPFLGNISFFMEAKALFYMVVVSIMTCLVAYGLLVYGIRLIGASYAAIFSTFEPVGGILGGMVFLSESLSMRSAVGCILIILAVLAAILFSDTEKA